MSEFATSRRAKWFILGSFVAGGLLVGHGTSRAPADHPESAPAASSRQVAGGEGLPWNVEGIIGGVVMMSGVLTAVPRRHPVAEIATAPAKVTAAVAGVPAVAPLLRAVPLEAA